MKIQHLIILSDFPNSLITWNQRYLKVYRMVDPDWVSIVFLEDQAPAFK